MTKNSKIAMWVIIALVVIGVIWLVVANQKTADQTTTTEPESVQDTTGETGTTAVTLSYANALVKYADRRIQLDSMCRAFPNTVTYKDNTGIMIDNRSAETRTVKVGTTFTIKPWGFRIVVLPDTYLKSKTLLVDCDGQQNVATVLVQE